MTLLICLPLILVIGGLAARRWFVVTRQDIRSIESHRSNLIHLEHLGPGEQDADSEAGRGGSAHVRIVAQPGAQAAPAMRPMVWGRVDGRPPAARPTWHAPREEPARALYEKARIDARESAAAQAAERRPAIVITDSAVARAADEAQVAGRAAPRRPAPPRRPRPEPASAAPPPDLGTGEPAHVSIGDLDATEARPPARLPAAAARAARPVAAQNRRAPRVLAAAAGLVVVAAGAGAAYKELAPAGPAGVHRTAAGASGPAPAGRPATTPAVPTSTVPPALAATSSSATDAIYTVTAGSLEISLATSSPCWVELRTGSPAGPVAFEGTLAAGASQTFSAGNGLWLRLGDPAGVQLHINGSAINLPAASNPFNVTVTTA